MNLTVDQWIKKERAQALAEGIEPQFVSAYVVGALAHALDVAIANGGPVEIGETKIVAEEGKS